MKDIENPPADDYEYPYSPTLGGTFSPETVQDFLKDGDRQHLRGAFVWAHTHKGQDFWSKFVTWKGPDLGHEAILRKALEETGHDVPRK